MQENQGVLKQGNKWASSAKYVCEKAEEDEKAESIERARSAKYVCEKADKKRACSAKYVYTNIDEHRACNANYKKVCGSQEKCKSITEDHLAFNPEEPLTLILNQRKRWDLSWAPLVGKVRLLEKKVKENHQRSLILQE